MFAKKPHATQFVNASEGFSILDETIAHGEATYAVVVICIDDASVEKAS